MIHVIGTVQGEIELDRMLTRLISISGDFSATLEEAGQEFRDIEKARFQAEGYGWAPLSPAYARRKEREYPGKTILRRTDRLYLGMTVKGASDNVSIVTATEGTFGVSGLAGLRGSYHQTGTSRMPQRTVIEFSEEEKRAFTKIIQQSIIRQAQEAGWQVLT